jgi:hypothetical protein
MIWGKFSGEARSIWRKFSVRQQGFLSRLPRYAYAIPEADFAQVNYYASRRDRPYFLIN